jgi:hypothetical protein
VGRRVAIVKAKSKGFWLVEDGALDQNQKDWYPAISGPKDRQSIDTSVRAWKEESS